MISGTWCSGPPAWRRTLQAGADWVYAQFYRLDRILWRFVRGLFTMPWMLAVLGLKLGLTYRYDNKREGIVGWIRKDAEAAPADWPLGREPSAAR